MDGGGIKMSYYYIGQYGSCLVVEHVDLDRFEFLATDEVTRHHIYTDKRSDKYVAVRV